MRLAGPPETSIQLRMALRACVESGLDSRGKKVQKACQGAKKGEGTLPPTIAILGYVMSASFCKEHQNNHEASLGVVICFRWQHLELICAPSSSNTLSLTLISFIMFSVSECHESPIQTCRMCHQILSSAPTQNKARRSMCTSP